MKVRAACVAWYLLAIPLTLTLLVAATAIHARLFSLGPDAQGHFRAADPGGGTFGAILSLALCMYAARWLTNRLFRQIDARSGDDGPDALH